MPLLRIDGRIVPLGGLAGRGPLPVSWLGAPVRVGGVDVSLAKGLGPGVRVKAVDGSLPSMARAINGALPAQVQFVGLSRGRPLDL